MRMGPAPLTKDGPTNSAAATIMRTVRTNLTRNLRLPRGTSGKVGTIGTTKS